MKGLPGLAESYAVSEEFLLLRMCVRFGYKPEEAEELPPAKVAVLMAADHVMHEQEDRRLAMLARVRM